MRKFDTKVQYLKYKVLREVAREAWKGTIIENLFDIPKKIVPGNTPTMRCCVYKERAIVAELIRERILVDLENEVPHGVAVSIESMKEREGKDIVDIEAMIYCEKDSHKGIIIGKKGAMLKKIGTEARSSIERFLGCKVNLQCWVKVKEDWRNREGLLRNFGFTEQ